MVCRRTILCNGEIYHVFNRAIFSQPLFSCDRDYRRMSCLFNYYRYIDSPLRYSHFIQRSVADQQKIIKELRQCRIRVEVLAFSLMPNHFHLLIRQLTNNGITDYLRLFQNSYAKYFNTKNARYGSLFQSLFKSVRIESSLQLIQVFRYIHLNPLIGYVVKDYKSLENYEWTSLSDYVLSAREWVSTRDLMAIYRHRSQIIQTHRDQANYQIELKKVKHLLLD